MTTYKCLDGSYDSKKALWVIKDAGNGYFQIIHVVDGKFLTYNTAMGNNSNKGRMRVHLQSTADGDNALFQITYDAVTNAYDITTKNGGPDNASRKYLNVTGNAGAGNQNSLIAANTKKDGPNSINVGGIIGLWTSGCAGDTNSKWYLESVLLTAPSISNVSPSNTITITDAIGLPTGYTIRYTIGDGSQADPTATTGIEYSDPINVTSSCTVKAVVVQYGVVLTAVASKAVSPAVDAPIITNNLDGTISLSTITSNAVMYYTTDGTTPSSSNGTQYSSAFSLGDATVIKAITYNSAGTATSSVTTYNVPQYTAPTISFNSSTSQVTISGLTGATIYYTTNGTIPSADNYSGTGTTTVTINNITSATTVKAIATHAGYQASTVAELAITQVATPSIQDNGSNAISITCATDGATIYYTTDGSTPTTTSSAEYTGPLTENVSGVTIKAIAVKENMITSAMGSGSVTLQCAAPVITRNGDGFAITCAFPTTGVVTIYYTYTTDGSTPADPTNSSSSMSSGGTVSCTLPAKVKAYAVATGYNNSTVAYTEVLDILSGAGTSDDPYLIPSQDYVNVFVEMVNTAAEAGKHYKVTATTPLDFSGVAAITQPFSGNFDGNLQTLTGLQHALFNTVNGGVVKNVMLDDVIISSGTNVGAICNEATGNTRIYNCGVLATGSTVRKDADGYDEITSCSSTIGGTGCVGGIVGLLDGTSRVINCFSYANITDGSYRGGIVGKNNVAYDASSYKTMVMNCMFYGDITITGSPTQIAPVYGGEIITNDGDSSGVNNFNYFRIEANYVQNTAVTKTYNCALGAETRFLQRFEFFRHLLNSNRELAAWWATGNVANKNEMMKWVMEPTQISTTTPYPILKTPGKYPSVVNYTPSTTAYDEDHRCQGRKLTSEGDGGVLHVTISMGTQGSAPFGAPTGAGLKTGESGVFDLTITDKDTAHFNFNYGKVQLPYYNDYCDGNYTGNRVVTGWKITSITGGTPGTYTASDTWGGYNFADRNCTNKDLYGTDGSNRIFNQGAYWDVPIGVTAITIEPYWAKAVYLSDQYWDVTYQNGTGTGTGAGYSNDAMVTPVNVTTVGGDPHSDPFNGQTIYNTMGNAISSTNSTGLFVGISEDDRNSQSVYDYAVVLVGNYHHCNSIEASKSKPYTITSIDLDGDNEPDYSYILRFDNRTECHPVRLDFINIPGLGMAQKSTGGTGSYNFGILIPKGWYESTNTSLLRFTQFEYEHSSRSATDAIIVQGGVMEQWVSNNQKGTSNKIPYIHVGGNVWFKEFHTGCHQDKQIATKHSPISVTGGDYDEFYLTGLYRGDVTSKGDNAECYINGGRFGTICGAAMEGIGNADGASNTGNITWLIHNSDIREFYAGGLNADKPVTGNLSTTIVDSHVDIFCGGPKFGDMSANKTVVTNATGCTFGTFFGAGYGGNSYSRQAPSNHNNIVNFPHNGGAAGNDASWNAWLSRFYTQKYNSTYGGVSTRFSYQFLPMSSNVDNVARIFVDFVKFSLATTGNVTSTLTDCTVTSNFYGGGSLGKVAGTVTSTLTNCTVLGNVYGAGFSASLPIVEVDSISFRVEPYYYENLGTYRTGVKSPACTTYTWAQTPDNARIANAANNDAKTARAIDKTNHILYTDDTLSKTNLGSVSGAVTLTLKGNTTVGTLDDDDNLVEGTGNVYGGGDESSVNNTDNPANASTTVNLQQGVTVHGNVFGGGNRGAVSGNSSVIIQDPQP